MRSHVPAARRHEKGFSIIELLIVVALILILSAIAVPNIGQYFRNYAVRSAAQQVASQMNQARTRAIMKNVSLGVVWGITGPTTSAAVVEDDQRPNSVAAAPPSPDWLTIGLYDWPTLLLDQAQTQAQLTLPIGVQFDNPANCGAAGPGTEWGIRFNRLGAACQFGTGLCGQAPTNAPAYAPLISVVNGTATVCLFQSFTGLRRSVTVTAGGRVVAQP